MKIGIIDADLLNKKKHRFPNLACMKISAYYKSKQCDVKLLLDYDDIDRYDKVFISKVFTETIIPKGILEKHNVEYGGTGFFYDEARPLDYKVEHMFPDYNLYDEWINIMLNKGFKKKEFEYYIDYSIGFTTRGCFRKCEFCVNKNYNKVFKHSEIKEFLDINRKYICLLDDNILGFSGWKNIILQLQETNKYFQFKQGMDERLLTEEKCELLSKSKYKGHYIFAFDDVKDKDIIEDKLKMWKKYTKKTTKFYVFCGFDREEKWNNDFWLHDIVDLFKRIEILMRYDALPYVMRYKDYEKSPYRGMYINIARWCNQPNFVKKKSFREFCIANAELSKSGTCATLKYMEDFEKLHPNIAKKYFDIKYDNIHESEWDFSSYNDWV